MAIKKLKVRCLKDYNVMFSTEHVMYFTEGEIYDAEYYETSKRYFHVKDGIPFRMVEEDLEVVDTQ